MNQREARKLTYRFDLPGGQDRLREMILYVCSKCEHAPRFGKTKLNKILWKADFDAFAERGVPVTGRAYQRLKAGPAPIEMPPLLGELVDRGYLDFKHEEVGGVGFIEERPIAKRASKLNFFSPDDIRFVDAAIAYFWEKSARKTSDSSHGVAWKTRDDLDPMPYESAYLSDEKLSPENLKRIVNAAQEHGWKSQ